MKNVSLTQQLAAYKSGTLLDSKGKNDTDTYNFVQWSAHCKKSSLKSKSKRLWENVITFLENTPGINTDNVYVFFRNNPRFTDSNSKPMLYDSFSIADSKSGEIVFWATPKSAYSGKAEINFFGYDMRRWRTPGSKLPEYTQKSADRFQNLFKK